MTEVAVLATDDTIRLPAEVAARFRCSDRFMLWAEGDAMYLKCIAPRPVTEIGAEVPPGEPMSLEELNEVVHQVHRRRRAAYGLRIVVDTNMWVSGLLWQGSPWELLRLAEAGRSVSAQLRASCLN